MTEALLKSLGEALLRLPTLLRKFEAYDSKVIPERRECLPGFVHERDCLIGSTSRRPSAGVVPIAIRDHGSLTSQIDARSVRASQKLRPALSRGEVAITNKLDRDQGPGRFFRTCLKAGKEAFSRGLEGPDGSESDMNQGIANHSDNNSPHGPAIVAPTLWTSGRNSRQLLTAEEQALIAVISTVVRFKKGERIYEEGDDANAVFSIITGVVKSYRTLPDRGQHIVGFLFADDVIGLAESGKYVNSAAAATAVTAYRIPTSRLEARLRNYPNLDFEVICKVCHELREAQRHAFLLSRHRAIAKVGLFLQMLEARENGTPELYLPMSRSDIGAYTAISPEAVSRSFRDLVRRGVISFRDRRHLRIIERTQLEAIISDTEARR